jgi:phosphatidylglycerol:prolipoprotein diacylglycerol transferase
MYPVLLSYAGHTLTSWILLVFIGVWAAYFSLASDLRRRNIKELPIQFFFVGCVVIWFVGAHLGQTWTVGFANAGYSEFGNPLSGLVLYAGVLAVLFYSLFVWLAGWRKKLLLAEFWDCGALAFAWVLGFGRIGCTLYGCCYGSPAGRWPGYYLNSVHWDYAHLNFPNTLAGVKLHPATLYEACFLLGGGAVLILLRQLEREKPGRFPPGVLGWFFWWGYAFVRFLTEWIRLDPRGESYLGLSPSQWFSLFFMVLGAVLIPFHWKQAAVPIYLRAPRRSLRGKR